MMGEYQKGEGATDFSSEGTEIGETEIISLVDRKGQGSKAVEGGREGGGMVSSTSKLVQPAAILGPQWRGRERNARR